MNNRCHSGLEGKNVLTHVTKTGVVVTNNHVNRKIRFHVLHHCFTTTQIMSIWARQRSRQPPMWDSPHIHFKLLHYFARSFPAPWRQVSPIVVVTTTALVSQARWGTVVLRGARTAPNCHQRASARTKRDVALIIAVHVVAPTP